MFDSGRELQRRTAQFAKYLKKMHRRSHKEVCGPCFMIFSEDDFNNEFDDDPSLSESVTPELEPVLAGFENGGFDSVTIEDDSSMSTTPDTGWIQDDSHKRFIQFSFEEKWFCVDMPRQTLYRAEAEKILRDRTGFFYLRDRPEFTLYGETVEGMDPFRKIYLYGDENIAAEDMAFVFFQVWNFPLDWRFFVNSSSFGDPLHEWEIGTPLE